MSMKTTDKGIKKFSKEDRYDVFLFCFLQGGRCQSLRVDDGYPEQNWKPSRQ
jgi:hypothetical protein